MVKIRKTAGASPARCRGHREEPAGLRRLFVVCDIRHAVDSESATDLRAFPA